MNVLFISYSDISLSMESVRTTMMLYTLADAGYHVDVVAPRVDLPKHPQINCVLKKPLPQKNLFRIKLCFSALQIVRQKKYQIVHAVDDAVFFAYDLCRFRKIALVYDARRCVAGAGVFEFSKLWKFSKNLFQRLEVRVLKKAGLIFTTCSTLSLDLLRIEKGAKVALVEDIPAQLILPPSNLEELHIDDFFDFKPRSIIVFNVLKTPLVRVKKILMAVRKIIDVEPDTALFFRGLGGDSVKKMVANLEIKKQCHFFANQDIELFFSILSRADTVVFVPSKADRYISSQLYSMLYSGVPLLTFQCSEFSDVLSEKNSVNLLPSATSVAEGVLRVLHEPLFYQGISSEGQQLMADQHTRSSFKHKIRMAYHHLFEKE